MRLTGSGISCTMVDMKSMPSFEVIAYLTPAIRTWLVNELLSTTSEQELAYLLFELGYSEILDSDPQTLKSFIKQEMSLLARRATVSAFNTLIKLCEGLVQFYLVQEPPATKLKQLNQLLPPGLHFSLVSGKLLFEPELFFQEHNLFYQEQSLHLLSDQTLIYDIAESTENPAFNSQDASPSRQTEELTEPDIKTKLRHLQFRNIRQRRLSLLKQLGDPL